jgi:uracil-DNA glycosylase
MTESTTLTFTDMASLHAAIDQCRRCGAAGHHIEGLPVFSEIHQARIMLIGQAPGPSEAEVRRPFNGDAGKRLFRWLQRAGWTESSFRKTAYISAVTKCFPGKQTSGKGDRVPSVAEQKLCRPWLDAEITLIKPELIIPVGSLAIKLFYPADVKLEDIIGQTMVDGEGRRIVPLPHPSGASRWHADPANVGRLETALFRLKMLKAEMGL